jgi:hypothetical protein
MRRLDKTIRFATKYKEWYSENANQAYSSTNPFRKDLLAELLIIQNGLCAYTEYRLVSESDISAMESGFSNGKQTTSLTTGHFVHLEHFDSTMKPSDPWLWENLFAVFGPINEEKNHLEKRNGIDEILKPDLESYEPADLLSYQKTHHVFIAHPRLDPQVADRVNRMILVLGLNNPFIKMKREQYLNREIKIAEKEGTLPQIHQFPTAFAFLTQNQA